MKNVNLKGMTIEELIRFSDNWTFTLKEQRQLGKELLERVPDDEEFFQLCEKILG